MTNQANQTISAPVKAPEAAPSPAKAPEIVSVIDQAAQEALDLAARATTTSYASLTSASDAIASSVLHVAAALIARRKVNLSDIKKYRLEQKRMLDDKLAKIAGLSESAKTQEYKAQKKMLEDGVKIFERHSYELQRIYDQTNDRSVVFAALLKYLSGIYQVNGSIRDDLSTTPAKKSEDQKYAAMMTRIWNDLNKVPAKADTTVALKTLAAFLTEKAALAEGLTPLGGAVDAASQAKQDTLAKQAAEAAAAWKRLTETETGAAPIAKVG